MGRYKINKELLPIKIHYFTYFAGVAALWPFIQVFGRQMGMTEMSTGVIFTAAPIFGIICNPLFGALADKYMIKKKLFLFFILFNIFTFLGFALLPYSENVNTLEAHNIRVSGAHCDEVSASKVNDNIMGQNVHDLHAHLTSPLPLPLVTIPINKNYNVDVHNESESDILEISTKVKDKGQEEEGQIFFVLTYESPIYWYYTFLIIGGWISLAVVTSIADALCFQSLGEKHHLYGHQRHWGAWGWGASTFLSGYLIDIMTEPNQPKNYTPCFYLVIICLSVNLVVSYLWKVEEEEKPKSMGKDLCALIGQPRIVVFILACIVVGICTGLQWNFLYWYVEDLTNGMRGDEHECEYRRWVKLLQGSIAAVQCLAEIPMFFLSGKIIQKLGHVNCFSLVLGAFGLRFLIYSIVTNPWAILPVELLQGLTYGIFYSTMASYAYIASPHGTGATVQSFVAAAFEGIGVGSGSLIAGACFKLFSGRRTFQIFGIFSLASCLLHVLVMHCINKKSALHEYEPPKTGQNDNDEDVVGCGTATL